MQDEEIAVTLAEHGKEIGSLKHRTKDLEEQNTVILELALSVRELALNMKNMMEEQKSQGARLEKLENEPAERWNSAKKTAFTAIISTLAGGLAVGLIMMIAQYV